MSRILYFHSNEPLFKLAESCLTLSPKVSLYTSPYEQLFIDILPTLKCMGGEEVLLSQFEELKNSFEIKGYWVLTDKAQWAASLSSYKNLYFPKDKSFFFLKSQPIEKLLYCGDPLSLSNSLTERKDLISFIQRIGIRSIGQFLDLPKQAILNRFGELGKELYEWAQGERFISLLPFAPESNIKESLDTSDICSLEGLLFALRKLLTKVESRLKGRSLLAKKIHLYFELDYTPSLNHTLLLSEPLRDTPTLLRILRETLKDLTWSSPLQRLELEVTDTLLYTPGQLSLIDASENKYFDIKHFITRLQSKYGALHIGCPHFIQSHLPEKSWSTLWPAQTSNPTHFIEATRPLVLFNPPRPYTPSPTTILKPLEKIATEWWNNQAERSYFIAEDPKKSSLWVYWDTQKKQWFIHGLFD